MQKDQQQIIYADDDTEPVSFLLRLRVPALCVGLLLGILITFLISRFEEVLAEHVQISFFMPFIVYMAAAVGNQTQSIYIRDTKIGPKHFQTYLLKETLLGSIVGITAGIATSLIAWFWLGNQSLALSLGLSMTASIMLAAPLSLITANAMENLREDPAVGAGPIATVLQDMASIIATGLICSAILL